MSTDRIEKKILLKAPLATGVARDIGFQRVRDLVRHETRRAVCAGRDNARRDRPHPGERRSRAAQKQYEGKKIEITIEQMEPERLISFRWHPDAVEPGVDYSSEPTTLIVFALERSRDGVMLTVTESGFDQIPLARRATGLPGERTRLGYGGEAGRGLPCPSAVVRARSRRRTPRPSLRRSVTKPVCGLCSGF